MIYVRFFKQKHINTWLCINNDCHPLVWVSDYSHNICLALKFFDQSVDIKSKIHMKQSGLHWKGFFALGEELTSGKPDNKEGIYFGEEYSLESEQVINKMAMHGPNQFPEPYNIWKTTVLKYMEELTTLGHIIMNAIALSLGLPSDFFEKQFCKPKPFTPFRIFRYPRIK